MNLLQKSAFIAMTGIMVFSLPVDAQAMKFSPVEKIGVFAEGPHPTIVRGQTAETENSVTFGEGQYSLKIEFSKGRSSKIGTFISASVDGKKLNCDYLGNNIYRTVGENGFPVYIAIGGPGISQEFSIVAKHNGKTWHLLDIDVLRDYIPRIGQLDYERAVYLLEPSTKDNTIILPFGVMAESNRGFIVIGEFRFKWNDTAGWFGVQKVDY